MFLFFVIKKKKHLKKTTTQKNEINNKNIDNKKLFITN